MNKVRSFNRAMAKLGFTLIELSIVLVIIGLIVGGVLVGQDLIKAAEIRATVSQLEKYATAVNTFRSKYNGLPGDLLNAANFGFDSARGTGMSDGDATIESVAGDTGTFAGEASCFWDDLTAAALIADSLNSSTACGTSNATTLTNALPQAKLGRSNYIMVGSYQGINYWAITGITAIGASAGQIATDDLLTTSESFQIDSKVDDGAPTSGSVMATVDNGAASAIRGRALFTTIESTAAAGAGVCVDSTTPTAYSFATNSGNDQSCQLRLRSNF